MPGTRAPEMPPDPSPPVPTLKIGQQGQGDTEQADPPADEADAVGRGILHHPRGDDLPARILGQPSGVVTGQGE